MADVPGPGRHRVPMRLVPDEPDQVTRLIAFRAEHPTVTIQPGQFRTWEARVREPDGETTIVRHTLRELLDRLGELLGDAGEILTGNNDFPEAGDAPQDGGQ
jgi:hypothetical protein